MNANNITVTTGRLGHDAEIQKLGSGTTVCNFSLAVDGGKDKDGERKTEWIDFRAFGKTAEMIGQYTKKGDLITVIGRQSSRTYEKDGSTRKISYNIVEYWANRTPKTANTAPEPAQDYRRQPEPQLFNPSSYEAPDNTANMMEFDEYDLPF